MTRKKIRARGPMLLALAALGVALALAPAVRAQAPQAAQGHEQAAQKAPAGEKPEAGSNLEAPPKLEGIDEILQGEEDVLGGGGSYVYDAGGRRDPFKSLLVVADTPDFRGPRPEGVPGLLIDEVDLIGIFRTPKGYIAQVQPANHQKSYSLREGDQLYDGTVVSINSNEVVFRQIVHDPTALKPFREVVKTLNP